jgi:hypothetical protein
MRRGLSLFQEFFSRNDRENEFCPTMSLPHPVSAINFPCGITELVHEGSPNKVAKLKALAIADRTFDLTSDEGVFALFGTEKFCGTPE